MSDDEAERGGKMLSGYVQRRQAKASRAIRNRFKLALLEKVPLLAGLSGRELQKIARLIAEVEVPAGTRLAMMGEVGREMFIIVEGEALVTTRPGRTTHLRSGDFFGEMSLLDGDPRSATVEATTPTRLLVLGRQAFWQLLDDSAPLVHKIMHTLSQRIRQAERSALDLDHRPPNR